MFQYESEVSKKLKLQRYRVELLLKQYCRKKGISISPRSLNKNIMIESSAIHICRKYVDRLNKCDILTEKTETKINDDLSRTITFDVIKHF